MGKLIENSIGILSAIFKTRSLVVLCAALCIPTIAMAHGPGLEKVNQITVEIAASGDVPELYVERAHVFKDNRLWQEALADYNKAAELDPEYVEYDLDRARLYYETGEFLSALDFVDLYLLRQQNTTEALLMKARIHRGLKQHQKAVESYELALSDLSTIDGRPSPEWYVEFADTLVVTGNKQRALLALQDGISQLGAISVFQVKAVELETELGLYDSALERVDQLMNQSQRKDIWLSRRADILSVAGRGVEAQETYQQAYAALQRLPLHKQNLPGSKELSATLQTRIKN